MVAPEVAESTRPRSSGLTYGRTRHTGARQTAAQGTGRINGPYRSSRLLLSRQGGIHSGWHFVSAAFRTLPVDPGTWRGRFPGCDCDTAVPRRRDRHFRALQLEVHLVSMERDREHRTTRRRADSTSDPRDNARIPCSGRRALFLGCSRLGTYGSEPSVRLKMP